MEKKINTRLRIDIAFEIRGRLGDVINHNGKIMDTDERASNLHRCETDGANERTNAEKMARARRSQNHETVFIRGHLITAIFRRDSKSSRAIVSPRARYTERTRSSSTVDRFFISRISSLSRDSAKRSPENFHSQHAAN